MSCNNFVKLTLLCSYGAAVVVVVEEVELVKVGYAVFVEDVDDDEEVVELLVVSPLWLLLLSLLLSVQTNNVLGSALNGIKSHCPFSRTTRKPKAFVGKFTKWSGRQANGVPFVRKIYPFCTYPSMPTWVIWLDVIKSTTASFCAFDWTWNVYRCYTSKQPPLTVTSVADEGDESKSSDRVNTASTVNTAL